MSGERAVLLFDADCGFCTRSAWFVRRRLSVDVELIGWQLADLDQLGVTAEACADEVQWVEDGRSWGGHQAVGRLLLASGSWWPLLGGMVLSRPGTWLARPIYRWVAAHRHRLPGTTPACALPPAAREQLRSGTIDRP